MIKGRIAAAFLIALATIAMPAAAQQPTADEIVRRLVCQPGQECMPPPPPGGRKRGFEPGGAKRSFEVVPKPTEETRQQAEQQASAGKLPTIDLQVTFDFNSDAVGPAARAALAPLGEAMRDPRLAASRFTLIGHTDGVGDRTYNQGLSERRAAAVKRYLVEAFGITAERLDAYGRGMTQMKNPADPRAAENRRVQVISQVVAASEQR